MDLEHAASIRRDFKPALVIFVPHQGPGVASTCTASLAWKRIGLPCLRIFIVRCAVLGPSTNLEITQRDDPGSPLSGTRSRLAWLAQTPT